ncbi:hypothetical protein FALBO_13795 [Fusarium albosuccineum]|uniref:Uncharacterized protein n=1 Tax=Fusarium albosuccineum TaxID=1237068 RepID=A0A8H4L0V4_9HYPO|nr:hypothetical protein FALBO_13795 [Fusarium albosuccineum]
MLRKGINDMHRNSAIQLYLPGAPLILKNPTSCNEPGLGVFCPPLDDRQRRSLDRIIINVSPLTARTEQLLAHPCPPVEDLAQLKQELLALEDEVVYWAEDRPSSWMPKVVGHVWSDAINVGSCAYCCLGPVEKYFDYYVATAWNSWRSIHIIYLDHLVHLTKALGQEEQASLYLLRVHDLVSGIKSSIPYFLSQNLEGYLQHANAGAAPNHSQRVVGGLLLLHPLYAVARCTAVPVSDREYLVNVLRWIGAEMGISHATILADYLQPSTQGPSAMQNSGVPFMDVLEGHFLISASMMLEPTRL